MKAIKKDKSVKMPSEVFQIYCVVVGGIFNL